MQHLLALLIFLAVGIATVLTLHASTAPSRQTLEALPLSSGWVPEQHSLSRYHPRWYAASVVFLAFDVEMLFMYPWAVVVPDLGPSAVIEMFVFLGVLLAAVAWARREGAFRWA